MNKSNIFIYIEEYFTKKFARPCLEEKKLDAKYLNAIVIGQALKIKRSIPHIYSHSFKRFVFSSTFLQNFKGILISSFSFLSLKLKTSLF